jgi:hypothetical protein
MAGFDFVCEEGFGENEAGRHGKKIESMRRS